MTDLTPGPAFNDLPIRTVEVVMTVRFVAHVNASLTDADLATKIKREVADAIEYRAVNLDDTSEGDALVALYEGGAGGLVETAKITVLPSVVDTTTAMVMADVIGTAAWM